MRSNRDLVDYLKSSGYIKSERVEKAFRKVDRAEFVPSELQDSAYKDRPLSIAQDATVSAPHMVAVNTELLDVKDNSKVLEIGSGSGYQAAILSQISKEVIGVEIQEELVRKSRERLDDYENVEILHGSGLSPVEDVFDRILYSAATDSFKDSRDYLDEDGVIVAPVVQNCYQLLKKYSGGDVSTHGRVRFVEMV